MAKPAESRLKGVALRASVAAFALGAWNVGAGLAAPDVRALATFPTEGARIATAAVGGVVCALAVALPRRGVLAWLGLAALSAWALGGFAILGFRPAAVAPAALLVVLLYWRRVLTARSPWAREPARSFAAHLLVAALVANVLTARALGAQFEPRVATWTDAAYFVVVTFSTVGYGDVVPATEAGRLVTSAMIAATFLAVAFAASVIVPPVVRSAISGVKKRMEQAATRALKGHVIVAGTSPAARALVRELREREVEIVLVHGSREFVETLEALDFHAIEGDPAQRATLDRANAAGARALVACDSNDAVNAFIILAARVASPSLHIVAMATEPENVDKLELAGANIVVSPPLVGGAMLGHAALGETARVEDLWKGETVNDEDEDDRPAPRPARG